MGHLDPGYEVEHDDGNLQQYVAHPSFPAGEHFSYEVTRPHKQASLLAICPGNLTYEWMDMMMVGTQIKLNC